MKKILIVPILLALVIFGLYHEDVVGKHSEADTHSLPNKELPLNEVPLYKEIVEVYNTDYDEMNETEEKKEFSVEIQGDLNTTKETTIVLTAVVKNAENVQACNYFWSENNKTIDIGQNLEMSFTKGEHVITVRALDANGEDTYATVIVRAYDYYMVVREHYNAYYGNLEYTEKEIKNHRGQYLLMDDGTYLRDAYVYDDQYRMIENTYKYYMYPTENKTVRYEYDNQDNRVREATFDGNGEMIYLIVNSYDEDGNLTLIQSGKDEDSLSSEQYNEQYIYASPYSEDSTSESTTSNVRKEYNENGKVTYEEVNYSDMQFIYEYAYAENDRIIKESSSMQSDGRFNSRTSYYNEKSQVSSYERKYGDENGVICHFKIAYTYNSEGNTATKVDQLLEGDCPYISEVKRSYNYDKNGLVKSIDSSLDGEKGYSTLKVIKTYTNELEL